jgi:hypothetical protein
VRAAIAGIAALAATALSALPAGGGSATVRVTLTDEGATLSPSSVIAGNVFFTVSNHGRARRDFEIAGKKTAALPAGRMATLHVTFAPHPYRYVSVGRRGRFTGYVGVLRGCATPSASSVTAIFKTVYRLELSRTSLPCGTVTFHVVNSDVGAVHSFNVVLVTLVNTELRGPTLKPGQSKTMIVKLPYKGQVYYFDAEDENAEYGDSGYLGVR